MKFLRTGIDATNFSVNLNVGITTNNFTLTFDFKPSSSVNTVIIQEGTNFSLDYDSGILSLNLTSTTPFSLSNINENAWNKICLRRIDDSFVLFVNGEKSDEIIDSAVFNTGNLQFRDSSFRDIRLYSEDKSDDWVRKETSKGIPDLSLSLHVLSNVDLSIKSRDSNITYSPTIYFDYLVSDNGLDNGIDLIDLRLYQQMMTLQYVADIQSNSTCEFSV